MTAAHRATTLGRLMTIDHQTPALGVIELAYREAQLDGSEPFVEAVEFDRSIAPALLAVDFDIVGAVVDPSVVRVHARAPLGNVLIRSFTSSTFVSVSSSTPHGAAELAELVRRRGDAAPAADMVSLRTWHIDKHPGRNSRKLVAPSWEEIAHNYPGSVRADIGALMSVERPRSNGKLILWHGPPGVGKTTAIRALMRQWSSWCQPEYISDPDRFFGEARYLLKVLEENTGAMHGPRIDRAARPEEAWRLIIAEDCDEYLRPSARNDAGAGLGRLLNLSDGLLGQGHNALILLSTNEDLSRLHSAVIRPGRCLAKIHFRPFRRLEAQEWLDGSTDLPAAAESLTLADLLELAGNLRPLGDDTMAPAAVGQYL